MISEKISLSNEIQPRRWQEEALEAWQQAGRRGTVRVVTGAGKTVFGELCIRDFLNTNLGDRIVILVPTQALLDQWYVNLQEDLNIGDEHIATYSSEGKAKEPKLINLLVLNTARVHAPAIARTPGALLIVDEVHRAASPHNMLSLRGNWSATLGLSATPDRDYDFGFKEHVVPRVGDIIYSYDYLRASMDGVIARFSLVNVETELLSPEQAQYDELTRKLAVALGRAQDGKTAGEHVKRLLRNRASISASAALRIPVAVKLVERHRGARTIVFHERIQSAETIVRILIARGVNATIYHSKLGPELRRDNLRLFRKGRFDVLVTCRSLDEGANVPEASVAVIACSTASSRQRIQRLGRVLRAKNDNQEAVIYTVYATKAERTRLEKEAMSEIGAESIRWLRISRA